MANDLISRADAINAINAYLGLSAVSRTIQDMTSIQEILEKLPSAEPEWNNHTVACLLAEMFGDDCACNFNGIDEWLPEKCEVIDSCPNPAGVACWEQFLKHMAERRTDGQAVSE